LRVLLDQLLVARDDKRQIRQAELQSDADFADFGSGRRGDRREEKKAGSQEAKHHGARHGQDSVRHWILL
jgi:hypothetical protein